MQGSIHIGTSGWSYRHWKEIFYPPRLKSASWLSYYAQYFDVTEINSSFYRLPSADTVNEWMKKVPPPFLFCPKMSRFLTHMKKLLHPEEPMERFFEVFELMKGRMGPVLVQLPPGFRFDYDRAENFYRLAREKYRPYEFVVEVRHESWLHTESLTLMSKYDIGLVISQSGNEFPYSEMVTAKNIYVRLHGPGELYASSYDHEMLQRLVLKFRNWAKEGHVIWVFFNNDIHGYAIENAKTMKQLLKN